MNQVFARNVLGGLGWPATLPLRSVFAESGPGRMESLSRLASLQQEEEEDHIYIYIYIKHLLRVVSLQNDIFFFRRGLENSVFVITVAFAKITS